MIFLVTSNDFLMLHSVPTTRYVVLKFALLYVSKDVTWTIFFTLHVPNFFLYYIYIGKPMHHVLHTPCPEFKACDFRWEQLHGFSFKPLKYICNCPYQISGHHVLHTPCPEFKACDFRWEQLHGFSFKPLKYICNCPYQISGHGV